MVMVVVVIMMMSAMTMMVVMASSMLMRSDQATALVRCIRQALVARQTKRTRGLFHADRQALRMCLVCFGFGYDEGAVCCSTRASREGCRTSQAAI